MTTVSIIITEKGVGDRRYDFDTNEITIGRVADGNDLVLANGSVSKKHARLMIRGGQVTVADLESANGTFVNGRKIQRATIVREDDAIYIGDFVLKIELPKKD
jgi:pSer/pThr/pTyr-binding forkhead associated (FHA) protein